MKLSRFITIPVALILIALAIANRHGVPLSFDPFSDDAPALAIRVPLWAIVFIAFLGGVILGGLSAWTARLHRHVRRTSARRAQAKVDRVTAKARAEDPLLDLPAITPRATPMLQPPRTRRRGAAPNRAAG
jgi:uncharacterized integral membrane protein